jgi:CHAT domain
LEVHPRKNFVIEDAGDGKDPRRVEIQPPAPGTPVNRTFSVRATDIGPGEVHVVFYQRQTPLARLVLHPRIVAGRTAKAGRVADRATSLPAPPLKDPLQTLYIRERQNGRKTSYEFRLSVPELRLNRCLDSEPIKGNKRKYVAGIYKKIEERWVSTKEDEKNFQAELKSIGVELFKELIPEQIQKALWDNRNKLTNIWVISSEPFIPWELVHLVDPNGDTPEEPMFFGQMGVVRWLENVLLAPIQIKVRKNRAFTVIPNYPVDDDKLPEAQEEFAFLKKMFGAQPVQPEEGPVRDLLKSGDFDLLHFACHGIATLKDVLDAKLDLQGRLEGKGYVPAEFDAGQVSTYANLHSGDNQPMIVLNACQTGRAGWRLTGIGGFANAFITREAGAFVGTLWAVGDTPARTFTETLYRNLKRGTTLSKATIAARAAAHSAGDATWLAYTVYGHPQMRISTN